MRDMTDVSEHQRATFTRMAESTREDWAIIGAQHGGLVDALADRVLDQLRLLDADHGGFAVDRLTHSLQTAHRAERDGHDDEYLVCALLHDVGDVLAPRNHPDIAAAILKPWVSEANHFMVAQHGMFQGYYFWHHIGGDRNARDRLKGHEYYDHTEEFVRKYDMEAFDPDYSTPPLEHYEPLLRSFFTRT